MSPEYHRGYGLILIKLVSIASNPFQDYATLIDERQGQVKELNPAQEWNMEKEVIFLVEEAPEGGYTARALGHDIFTEADSFAELKKMVQDAMQCHFEAEEMPRLIRLHMVKDEVIAV